MSDADETIAAVFAAAEGDDLCAVAAPALRELYEGEGWESSGVVRIVTEAWKADGEAQPG